MKKKPIVLLVSIVVTMLIMMMDLPHLQSKNVEQNVIPVDVEPAPDTPGNEPRGPVFNPFSAYLKNNQLVLESVTSYGLVDVELVSTAGDFYITVFDTGDVSILIPVSGLAGKYTLQLTDASGMHFMGEFVM